MPDANEEWVDITGSHSDEVARVTVAAWDRVWSKKVDPDTGAPLWSLVDDTADTPADAPVVKPAAVKAQARTADADKPGGNT